MSGWLWIVLGIIAVHEFTFVCTWFHHTLDASELRTIKNRR